MAEDNNKGRPDGLPLNGNTDELAGRLIIKNDVSFKNKTHIGTLPANDNQPVCRRALA